MWFVSSWQSVGSSKKLNEFVSVRHYDILLFICWADFMAVSDRGDSRQILINWIFESIWEFGTVVRAHSRLTLARHHWKLLKIYIWPNVVIAFPYSHPLARIFPLKCPCDGMHFPKSTFEAWWCLSRYLRCIVWSDISTASVCYFSQIVTKVDSLEIDECLACAQEMHRRNFIREWWGFGPIKSCLIPKELVILRKVFVELRVLLSCFVYAS